MRADTLSPTERPQAAPTETAPSLLVAGSSWPPAPSLARLIQGLGRGGCTVTIASGTAPDAHWFVPPRFNWLPLQASPRFAAVPPLGRAWMATRAILRSPADAWHFWSAQRGPASLARRLRVWYWMSPFAGRRWDVVYFPDPEAAFAYPALYDIGCPVIVSAFDEQRRAGDLVPGLAVGRRLPWIFTKATRLHCASRFVLRHLAEGGVDPAKVVVVPPDIDLEFFRPRVERSPHPGYRIVTTVGSGLSTQGLEHILLAVQRLKRSSIPVRLEMLGDCVGEERHRALFTIQDLDLSAEVHLHGALTADATRLVLTSADVFVNADLGTDLSVTALYAMACGLPIVTVDSGGTCEIIANHQEGRIVPAWSPEALTRALAELWMDVAARRRLGEAARRRVADTVPLASERLLALCRDAAHATA